MAEWHGITDLPGVVMDGRVAAQAIRFRIKEQVRALKQKNVEPNLVTMLVGDNPASRTYLKNKHAACMDVGIKSRNMELKAETPQCELEETIKQLNEDQTVTGILLQLPLPTGLDEAHAVSTISAQKDVDGLNPDNLGQLFQKEPRLVPCTPKGVVVLLNYYGVKAVGQHAVVVNRSRLVGRPLCQLLLNHDATVTVCHSKTRGLREMCRQGDILITGIGRRSQFTVGADFVKPGAAVVDVGISSVDGRLMGDVDFNSVLQVASYVSPVPGGVGPMTIAMLLYNTLLAACLQRRVELEFNPEELGPQ